MPRDNSLSFQQINPTASLRLAEVVIRKLESLVCHFVKGNVIQKSKSQFLRNKIKTALGK